MARPYSIVLIYLTMSHKDCHETGDTLWTGAAKRVKDPFVIFFVVAENISVAVIGAQLEATVTDAVPLVENLHHLKDPGIPALRTKAKRALISFVSRVAFNMECLFH